MFLIDPRTDKLTDRIRNNKGHPPPSKNSSNLFEIRTML